MFLFLLCSYDMKFTGCWWVFEEEYYIINDFLLPGFFIATQFFFTLCLTLVLVAMFLTWMYCFCSKHHDKYLLLLLTTGTDLICAGNIIFIVNRYKALICINNVGTYIFYAILASHH